MAIFAACLFARERIVPVASQLLWLTRVQASSENWPISDRRLDPEEIQLLEDKARDYILHYEGQQVFDFDGTSRSMDATEEFIDGIESVLLNGPQLILNKIYNEIGFDAIDDVLRNLVIARIC